MKVRVRMLLDVTKEFTDAEVVDLWPEAALGDEGRAVDREERLSLRVDPAQYAAVLLAQGAEFQIKVDVST